MIPYCIGMDAVIQFGYLTVQIPVKKQATILIGLKSSVIFHDIQLKFRRYPRGKRDSYVTMCICTATIPSRFRYNTFGIHLLNPFRRCHNKTIQTRFIFNRLELHTVKIWIVKCFPNSKKFNGISVTHPVLNNKTWIIHIPVFCYICQRNKFIFEICCIYANINIQSNGFLLVRFSFALGSFSLPPYQNLIQ